MAHKHLTNIEMAADELLKHGNISAYDAVYTAQCSCGEPRRNTRLAATISVLRHKYGWVIHTAQDTGRLAEYRLVSAGTMVSERTAIPTRPTANRKPVVTADDVPVAQRWYCPHCTEQVTATGQPLLGGFREAKCFKCGGIDVRAMPWKPAKGIENVKPKHIGRRSQARKTYG